MRQFETLTQYIVIHKDTKEPLFGNRLFTASNHAKTAFKQKTKSQQNGWKGVYFNEQDDYQILELVFTLDNSYNLQTKEMFYK